MLVALAVFDSLRAAGCDTMKAADTPRTTNGKALLGRVRPGDPYSPGVSIGNLVFLSTTIGRDPATDQLVPGGVKAETKQVMENLRKLLEEAGLDFSDVVKTSVYLTDHKDRADMNEVYSTYFTTGVLPARTTIQTGGGGPGRVGIEVIAVRR